MRSLVCASARRRSGRASISPNMERPVTTWPNKKRKVQSMNNAKTIQELIKRDKIEIVDLKFVDLPGVWQHFSIPADDLSDELFDEGIGFDGSSIRGFQQIQESDMLLVAD